MSETGAPEPARSRLGAGPEPARSRARNPQPPPEGLGSVSSFQTLLGPLWGACGVPLGRCLADLWMIWAAFSYLACVRFLMHFRDVFCEGCSIMLFVFHFREKGAHSFRRTKTNGILRFVHVRNAAGRAASKATEDKT